MYRPSVFSFHSDAYKLIFRNFFHNYFNYIGFGIFTVVAIFNPILLPIVILFTTAYFVAFSEKGIANIRASLKNVDMDVNRYLNLFIISGLKNAIILAGYVLFLVPGIILSFGLAPVNYNIVKKPDAKASEIIESSWNSMNGYKGYYFAFTLIAYLPLIIVYVLFVIITIFLTFFGYVFDFGFILVPAFGFLVFLIALFGFPIWFAEVQLSKAMFFKYISSEKTPVSANTNADEPGLQRNNNSAKLPF